MCITCTSGNANSRRKLIGIRRVKMPCGKVQCDCAAPTCTLWREILTHYRPQIDFLNADPNRHFHDITLDDGVALDKLRRAQEAAPGDLMNELQAMGAKKHRDEEKLSEAYLRKIERDRIAAIEARKKQEEEDRAFAKKMQDSFESQKHSHNDAVSCTKKRRRGSEYDRSVALTREEQERASLEAFFRNNPEVRREHENAIRREKERRTQLEKDEAFARELAPQTRTPTRSVVSRVSSSEERPRKKNKGVLQI